MSIFEELHNHPLQQLDLGHYCRVSVHDSVQDVVQQMQVSNSNCAFVMDNDALVGIFTDRDVLQKVATHNELWSQPVSNVMTPDPVVARSDYSIATALKLMDEHHVRNLPVLTPEGSVAGNFTHHAFMRYLADYFPTDIYNRPSEARRTTRHRHGA